jgi:chaperone required for assembly of F1-ATPase
MSKANSEWAPRRFWKATTTEATAEGWRILLDGKPVLTPARAPMLLPSAAVAEMVAREWDAQGERIDPASMPATRMANSAIDKVTPQHAAVTDIVAAYGGSDLLCYRASHPRELVARQQEWDAPLTWAQTALGAKLATVTGIMPSEQDPETLAHLTAQVAALDAFELAPFHDLVSLSGSLVLGFAAAQGALDGDEAWRLSRIDEDYEADCWGQDDEAASFAAGRKRDFLFALEFLRAVRA